MAENMEEATWEAKGLGFYFPTESRQHCQCVHGLKVMTWSTGGLLGLVSLNKTDSPTPSSHQLSITPQLGLEVHTQLSLPCWAFAWLEFLKVLCRLLQMAWVHMCNCPAVSERQCFITIVHHLWLCSYSVPSAVMMAEPWLGMGGDADVPLRAEYFIVSYSLLVLGGAHL